MSPLGRTRLTPFGGGQDEDDLFCPVCATPLLSKKSTCPKCGNRWDEALSASTDDDDAMTVSSSRKRNVAYGGPPTPLAGLFAAGTDDLLTASYVLMAGMGLSFAALNLFLGGFGLADIWRSLMAAMAALALLGLRRLVLKD